MHYWNKQNFEGLIGLGNELRSIPELGLLAEYCFLREKGLRSKAFTALNEFIGRIAVLDVETKRRITVEILCADARTPAVHQFLTQPILSRIISPVLEDWATESPEDNEPLRWLGLLRSDADFLQKALELSPEDLPVRCRLIDIELSEVDFATHHMGESIILSPLESCRDSLAAAKRLIDKIRDDCQYERFMDEYRKHDQLLNDWEAFSNSDYEDFPRWCKGHGRVYQWGSIVYYK